MKVNLLLLLAVLLAIVLRILPRAFRMYATDSDTTYHLLAAEQIRENKLLLPTSLKGFILQTPYTYPPLYHYILAFFPRQFRERIEPYLGGVVDGFHSMTIFWLISEMAQPSNNYPIQSPGLIGILAVLIFATYPSLLGATPPRAFQGTPRPLGEWLLSMTLVFMGVYLTNDEWPWFIAAILFAALVLLTSKFGAQVLAIVSVFLTAWMHELAFFILMPAAILTAIVISRGHYIKILRGHIQHSLFYQQYIIRSHPIKYRNRSSDLMEVKRNLFRNPKKVFEIIYFRNTVTALVLKNPALVLVGGFMLGFPQLAFIEYRYLSGWVLACLIAFLLTSFRPLLFLGEAERYVEYSTPAVSILLSAILIKQNSSSLWFIFSVILIYSMLNILGNYLMFIRTYPKERPKQIADLIDWLRKISETTYILPIPGHLLGRLLPYKTHHRVLFFSDNLSETHLGGKEFLKIFPEYPFPSSDIQYFSDKYKINMIVCDKQGLKQAKQRGVIYDFSRMQLAFENADFCVYNMPDMQSETNARRNS